MIRPAIDPGPNLPKCEKHEHKAKMGQEQKPVNADIHQLLKKSLHDLKQYLLVEERTVPEKFLLALENDGRLGVRQLARLIRKRRLNNRIEGRRLHHLLRFEMELWHQGLTRVAGVDEAGMAPLAGPVVAAAVILPINYRLRGLDDSKKIHAAQRREALAARIKRDAISWAVGCAEVHEIDTLNIYHAGLLAMSRAVERLGLEPEYLLVDARTVPHCSCPQRGIVHGDALSASIAAASVLAKTTRDGYMCAMDKIYPEYGFASHKGYPTREHVEALKKFGPLPLHRRSFAPVREILGFTPAQGELF
jgi:ribonuclease HII